MLFFKSGSIIYMGVEKEIKKSINNKFIVLCFCQNNIRKEFVFMQNNFITFRPEIKDVKIKRVELICDTYHVYGIRTDISQNCCDRKMNIHDYRTLSIRSLSYGNRKVILHIEKQRYVCPICNKRTTSSIGIVDRNCSISNEVKDEIRKKLSEMKSFTQIGREENTSISTVMRIFHDIEVPHKELDYETVYLDEFRLTNSSD